MHKIVPIRGLLTEARIAQEAATPLYIDSASTCFVAQSRGAVKKSARIRRRAEVLTESFDMGETDPVKIEEFNEWTRHSQDIDERSLWVGIKFLEGARLREKLGFVDRYRVRAILNR